ncbi:electron transfer flavoprotein subunit alpha/FixB family protein [Moorella sulfitireducens]|uniref:electron transfer flavoprotein subunit alpha/FixB family protein n=1 Tax=Neomoorella sulfitireducens TaxID=2972948 RepID=UPI0021AC526A|nr:electron transfer flavoprotein subunit alpha/FixB family protein [Moorella sulfitireducens]
MAGTFVIYADKPAVACELISFSISAGKKACVVTFDAGTARRFARSGAGKVLVLEGENRLLENYARALAGVVAQEGAEAFVAGSTVRGRELAARVAGYLDWPLISDVSSVRYEDGAFITERLMYGGAVVRKEKAPVPAVLTIPGGKFEPPAEGEEEAEIVTLDLQPDTRISLVERSPLDKRGVDLSAAEKIVCAGMGFAKKEDLALAGELAQVLGAEIGCSRGVAEERKWLPADAYIGISGATVKPRLYLSLGVSGQVQHVVGIRDSKLIVAVDINENAPIFRAADYGIVGDLYEVVPLLIRALQSA